MPRGFHGWKKDPPKAKDFGAHQLLSGAAPPPEHASLRDRAGSPFDQVRSDCVANSVAKALQTAVSKPGVFAAPFSRNWLYYQAGCLEQSQQLDNGRYIRDALDACGLVGCPSEAVWPYDDRWNKHPGATVARMAYDFHIAFSPAYYRIDLGPARQLQMKQAIAAGHPIVVGSSVSQAFEDQDGLAPLPYNPAAPSLGGHAYSILEYDPEGLHLLNSWGDWAQGGWGYLGWDWCDAFEDVWVITLEAR